MDEEAARIRGYLQAQAAKLPVPEIMAKVRADLGQLKAALDAFPVGRWEERPAEGEWSGNEVAAHLASSSKAVALGIVQAVEEGTRPGRIRDVMERTDERRAPGDWWTQFDSDREELFARLATAKGDEHLDVVWEHPMFGELNWREWLLFTRLHDLDHARQLQAAHEKLEA